MKGVPGRSRRPNGKRILDVTSDRGPDHLTDLEGDYVHSVGLMNACYGFAVRTFVLALSAWMAREGLTVKEAARRLGLDKDHLSNIRVGKYQPSHATMMNLRKQMTGDDWQKETAAETVHAPKRPSLNRHRR